jgi:hypothetical protein
MLVSVGEQVSQGLGIELRVRSQCQDMQELAMLLRPLYRNRVLFVPTEDTADPSGRFAFRLGLADDTVLLRASGERVDPFACGLMTGGYRGIAVQLAEVDERGQAFLAELERNDAGTQPFGVPAIGAGATNRVLCSVRLEQLHETTQVPDDAGTGDDEATNVASVADSDDEATSVSDPSALDSTKERTDLVGFGEPTDLSMEELATMVESERNEVDQDNQPTRISPAPAGPADAAVVGMPTEIAAAPPIPDAAKKKRGDTPVPMSVGESFVQAGSQELTGIDAPPFPPLAPSPEESAAMPKAYALPSSAPLEPAQAQSGLIDPAVPGPIREGEAPRSGAFAAAKLGSTPVPATPMAPSPSVPTPAPPNYPSLDPAMERGLSARLSSTTDMIARDPSSQTRTTVIVACLGVCLGLGTGYLLFGGDAESPAVAATAPDSDQPASTGTDEGAAPADDEGAAPADDESGAAAAAEQPVDDEDTAAAEESAPDTPSEQETHGSAPDEEQPGGAPLAAAPPLDSKCSASVSSTPEGAALFHDQLLLGATPYLGPVPCDATRLELRLPGYNPASAAIEPGEDGPAELSVVLQHPRYRVKLTSVPHRAFVKKDGKFVGRTPVMLRLPAYETTTVTVARRGFSAQRVEIEPHKPNERVFVRLERRRRGRR